MKPPRTSSQELHQFLTGLGLSVELDPKASTRFDTVVGELIDWYADPDRAAAAKVISHATGQPAPRAVLTEWLGHAPPEDGDANSLFLYSADVLLCAAVHGGSHLVPQVLALHQGSRALYLLRSGDQRKQLEGGGWFPNTVASPDTEAALEGMFRDEGCTPGFANHASGCKTCLEALQEWDREQGLPFGFEAFMVVPPRPTPPAAKKFAEELARPWWKFW